MTTREAPDASISFDEEKNEKGLRPSRIERTSDKPAPNPSSLSKESPVPFPGYRNRGYIRRKVTPIGSTPVARIARASRRVWSAIPPRQGGRGPTRATRVVMAPRGERPSEIGRAHV